VTRRAFGSQLAVVALALAVGGLAEAFATAGHALSRSVGEAALAGVYAFGLWALPAAVVAAALAWPFAAFLDEASPLDALREGLQRPERRDAFLLGVLAGPLLFGGVFAASRAAGRFHNLELAAALVAASALVLVIALGGLALLAYRALRRRGDARAPRAVVAAAFLVPLGVSCWVLLLCRPGLAQLDARLLLLPLALAPGFVVADVFPRLRDRAPMTLGIVGALSLLSFGALCFGGEPAFATLANDGAWSKSLLAGARLATDFDGDGYSGLFGGGDCAPFDAAINPSAAEIPGDGVDNNCIGGDAGKALSARRPSWGQSAHGAPKNLNVVIVTIETLRRDHASFLGAVHDTTPTLRALTSESLVFEKMYSAAPYTRLAVASLFSSYAPSEIDWLSPQPGKRARRIGPQTPWLPERLRARGYETIAVLTDFSAFTPLEDIGFERGFQHYDVSTRMEYRGGTMWGFPAAEQIDKALGYVEKAQRPFLLWLHLFEPHYRYEQPPDAPLFGRDEQSRYDAEIWHDDHELSRLIEGLRKLGVWDSSVLFVSGDHGEAFGEHQDRWHGTNLFDPQLRPAALLRVPGMSGKRVVEAVTFTDVAPTLARILGDRETFEQLHGRSLTPLLHHGALPGADDTGFVAETFEIGDGQGYLAAFIKYPLKLIYVEEGRRFSLYDLAADAAEQHALDPGSDPRGAPLLRELTGYLERTRARR
jgi:choline-sulfatase